MAPNPDAPESTKPKQGWFDRLKASVGFAKEATEETTAGAAVSVEAAPTAAPEPTTDVTVGESQPLQAGEPLVDVPTEAGPGMIPTVASDVAISPAGEVSVPVPPLQPAATSPVAETVAPLPSQPTPAEVVRELPTVTASPAVLDEAPVTGETAVSLQQAESATLAAEAMVATETPTVADETGVPAEEAAPGTWLTRFAGRFGLGLGTPKAPEEAAALPSGDVAAADVHLEEGPAEVRAAVQEERRSWFSRLSERLGETRQGLINRVHRLTYGRTKIDEEMLEELEEILLTSDVGPKATDDVLTFLRGKAKDERFLPDEVVPALREYLSGRLSDGSSPITAERGKLTIFLMVGVNGVGKTTTTGKIAAKFRLNDYKVLLAAADTFRAAAIDQLQVWAQRAGVDLIRHAEGGDAAAVVFDGIRAAKARGSEVLIVDTAGRLHTKHNLMEELSKIRRIVEREAPDAIVETLLVLDATTGQNGLRQAEVFGQATPLTGVILTKLDGTAKGGVVFSIKETLGLPIRLLGVGEGLEDLREFDPNLFVEALFASTDTTAA